MIDSEHISVSRLTWNVFIMWKQWINTDSNNNNNTDPVAPYRETRWTVVCSFCGVFGTVILVVPNQQLFCQLILLNWWEKTVPLVIQPRKSVISPRPQTDNIHPQQRKAIFSICILANDKMFLRLTVKDKKCLAGILLCKSLCNIFWQKKDYLPFWFGLVYWQFIVIHL